MATLDQQRSALPVPYAMGVPDRVRKERYYDPEFFRLECEQLWSYSRDAGGDSPAAAA